MTTNKEEQTHPPCTLEHECGDGHSDADAGDCHCYQHNVYHCFECVHDAYMRMLDSYGEAVDRVEEVQREAGALKKALLSAVKKIDDVVAWKF